MRTERISIDRDINLAFNMFSNIRCNTKITIHITNMALRRRCIGRSFIFFIIIWLRSFGSFIFGGRRRPFSLCSLNFFSLKNEWEWVNNTFELRLESLTWGLASMNSKQLTIRRWSWTQPTSRAQSTRQPKNKIFRISKELKFFFNLTTW